MQLVGSSLWTAAVVCCTAQINGYGADLAAAPEYLRQHIHTYGNYTAGPRKQRHAISSEC